jgi:hypothetical protein
MHSKPATQTDSTGKVSKGVEFDTLQVVEKMERETGIEPATNSLEGCESIENKEQLRSWRKILTIIFHRVPRLTPRNGA